MSRSRNQLIPISIKDQITISEIVRYFEIDKGIIWAMIEHHVSEFRERAAKILKELK